MKQSVSPAVMATVVVVVVIAALFFGYRYLSGGSDGDTTQARINMYKNARGPVGSGNGSSPAPGNGSGSTH
jgi:hypothetical protein